MSKEELFQRVRYRGMVVSNKVSTFISELDQYTIVNRPTSKRCKIIIQFLLDSGANSADTK